MDRLQEFLQGLASAGLCDWGIDGGYSIDYELELGNDYYLLFVFKHSGGLKVYLCNMRASYGGISVIGLKSVERHGNLVTFRCRKGLVINYTMGRMSLYTRRS